MYPGGGDCLKKPVQVLRADHLCAQRAHCRPDRPPSFGQSLAAHHGLRDGSLLHPRCHGRSRRRRSGRCGDRCSDARESHEAYPGDGRGPSNRRSRSSATSWHFHGHGACRCNTRISSAAGGSIGRVTQPHRVISNVMRSSLLSTRASSCPTIRIDSCRVQSIK